ncbi:hypothetical protein [Hyphomonas sp.]|uniref:hypothetical protein n=1 Tax=Hyphomonas sp. TaxID=87 RepID=UPI0025BEB66A|nr:hypothetical protein [Hyphomonas sp.]
MSEKVTHIYSFLVKPYKGRKSSATTGVSLSLSGKLFDMLEDLFLSTDNDFPIDIAFRMAADGSQNNPARNMLGQFGAQPNMRAATNIARKLELVTTKRSKLGLLFLLRGMSGARNKIVVSRFPADSGILADEKDGGLSVEYLERVFMKNAKSYKAVVYKNLTPTSNTWKGRAVDRQINDARSMTPEYWIFDFLESEFVATSASGTKRLAEALKRAASISKNLAVKQQIAGAGMLLANFQGHRGSIDDIATKLNFSKETRDTIRAQLKNPSTMSEVFVFDQAAFDAHFRYRSIVLDNGGVMTAEATKFADIFIASGSGPLKKFRTEGRVVDERIVKRRIGGGK